MSQPTITDTRILVNDEEIFTLPVGSVLMWLSSSLPTESYLLCDGTSFSPSEYPDLFDVIGNTYGGTVSEPLLPDLGNRSIIGGTVTSDGEAATTITLTTRPPVETSENKTGGNSLLFPSQLIHTHNVTTDKEYLHNVTNIQNTDFNNDNADYYTVTARHNNATLKSAGSGLSSHLPPHRYVNYIIYAGYNAEKTGGTHNHI